MLGKRGRLLYLPIFFTANLFFVKPAFFKAKKKTHIHQTTTTKIYYNKKKNTCLDVSSSNFITKNVRFNSLKKSRKKIVFVKKKEFIFLFL